MFPLSRSISAKDLVSLQSLQWGSDHNNEVLTMTFRYKWPQLPLWPQNQWVSTFMCHELRCFVCNQAFNELICKVSSLHPDCKIKKSIRQLQICFNWYTGIYYMTTHTWCSITSILHTGVLCNGTLDFIDSQTNKSTHD